MNNRIVSARNICMDFEAANGTIIKALNEVNFEIVENEFVCILGPNGSGKSTLLRLITKDIKPITGEIIFRKTDIDNISDNDWSLYLGKIYQNPNDGLANYLTVEENLLLALLKGKELSLFSNAYTKRKRKQLLDKLESIPVDFEFELGQKVNELSGGQRQLLALLMVYIQSPGILLLDEPTASLDPKNSAKITRVLSEWSKEKLATILMVTHQIELALSLKKSRILVLNHGKITHDIINDETLNKYSINEFKNKFIE